MPKSKPKRLRELHERIERAETSMRWNVYRLKRLVGIEVDASKPVEFVPLTEKPKRKPRTTRH